MAQARFIPIFTATTGLNNALDPARLQFDIKTGVTELAQAVNVNIDISGRPSRRLGRTQASATPARCGFVHGEICLLVSGTELRLMREDFSTSLLRGSLTPGARMRYWPVADRIYYTNGQQQGYIAGDQDHVWSKGNYQLPHETNRQFADPPRGHLVSWFASRMLLARDNAVWASEPSFYGVFDLARSFKLEAERITMLQPTSEGLWVGTAARVLFYRGDKWEQLRREAKAGYGVLEGSDVHCPSEQAGTPGDQIIFTTPRGICTGGEDGSFVNVTENKLVFPTGRHASATMAGGRYIVTIEP